MNNDPLNQTDPYGLWTLQIGGSLGYTLPLGYPGTLFAGIAIDLRGGAAIYYGGGIGYGSGAGGSISGGAVVPTAPTVSDLGGAFLNANVGAGTGGHVSVDTFTGPSSNGFVTGIGLSGGVGLGGASYVDLSDCRRSGAARPSSPRDLKAGRPFWRLREPLRPRARPRECARREARCISNHPSRPRHLPGPRQAKELTRRPAAKRTWRVPRAAPSF